MNLPGRLLFVVYLLILWNCSNPPPPPQQVEQIPEFDILPPRLQSPPEKQLKQHLAEQNWEMAKIAAQEMMDSELFEFRQQGLFWQLLCDLMLKPEKQSELISGFEEIIVSSEDPKLIAQSMALLSLLKLHRTKVKKQSSRLEQANQLTQEMEKKIRKLQDEKRKYEDLIRALEQIP